MTARGLIVLAAGGTGGHVFPAEALARELQSRGYRLALVTDRRGDAYGGALGDLETHRIQAGGIAGKSVLARIRSVAEIGVGTLQARTLLKRLMPDAVIGFGGYASVPTMLAAALAGLPSAIHEQNAILGRANRLLADRVRRIAVSFADSRAVPGRAKSKVVHTGMPVRPNVQAERGHPYPSLSESGPVSLLVLGGSQGARVLSQIIPAAIAALNPELRGRLKIVQQCRPEDLAGVEQAYRQLGVEAELSSFFGDVPARLVATHLVIARAGASTVAEALCVGRPAILIPYPYAIDDHQTLNAHAVDQVGAGWLIPESALDGPSLAGRIQSLFGMPTVLSKAAEAAHRAGRPDATERLADVIDQLVAGGNGAGSGERKAA